MAIERFVDFTLEVLAPAGIFCEVLPVAGRVRQGRPAIYQVNFQSSNDRPVSVAFEVLGLTGAVAVFSANPVALGPDGAGTTTMTIETAALPVAAPVALRLKVTATE